MTEYVFDLETNGLLDELDTIHSLVLKDVDTGEVFSYRRDGHPDNLERMNEGVRKLMEADQIAGHNIIRFDLPAIQKLYPWFTYDEAKVTDTLILSRVLWPNLDDIDWGKIRKGKTKLPGNMAGLHKLEAWGYRLGLQKGEYSKERENWLRESHHLEGLPEPTEREILDYVWGTWNQEMQDYCELDVEVTHQLLDLIKSKNLDERCWKLEMEVAFIIAQQERNGFGFNVEKAKKLAEELQVDQAHLSEELQSLFKPWWVPDGKPKAWAKSMKMKTGEVREAGAVRQPIKLQVFNPGSRQQIADRLQTLRGWVPKEFTPTGQPQIDEAILADMPWPEAQSLAKYFQVKKLLGQLADGDKAWFVFERDGRIHGSCNTNGAVTGRATHSFPNLAQVPSVKAYRGVEARELFGPLHEDHVQLGCDVSGLELRMLGHFMAKHDDGKYAREVVEGDVHWTNVQALTLVEPGTARSKLEGSAVYVQHVVFREGTKTFIYAFLYGAGGEKIGTIIYDIALAEEAKGLPATIRKKFFKGRAKVDAKLLTSVGNRLKREFLKQTPALKELIEGVKGTAEKKGELTGLDGRKLHIRSPHAALNTLLQSAGALVCKKWLVEFHKLLKEHGLTDRVFQMVWVHDEVQLSVHKSLVNEDGKTSIVGDLCVEAIKRAGEYFNIRVPLTGEYKIGSNWAECH